MSRVVPYDELDPPIRDVVAVLNELSLETIGSCGGHETPISKASLPPEEWYVAFRLLPADPAAEIAVPSPQAWLDLEFLAYHISALGRSRAVSLVAFALPPHLNEPGRMLQFELWGRRDDEDGIEPDEVAASLRHDLKTLYVQGGELPRREENGDGG
jgi:hypothetical protein